MEDEIMEKKILDYLGVTDVDIHFQDVHQLENYTLTFQDGNYFKVNGKVEPNFKIEHGYKFENINKIIANLKGTNDTNIKLRNQRKYKSGKYFPFDTGHLLGIGLIKYLKICNKQKDDNSKKTALVKEDNNLIPQFQRANRNKKKNIGQERFENWLTAYLRENPEIEVYYEVEKIYKNNSDGSSLPIGTRILAFVAENEPKQVKKNSQSKLKLPFHVFIPNYQFSSDCKGQKDWPSFDLKDSQRLYEDGKYLREHILNNND